ncbi:hypothetical protein ABG067_001471, partial [Albugo candida]
MEIDTPLSPTPISANQPVAMEVDDKSASSASKPVKTASETDHRPSLAEILNGQEEVRKDKAVKKRSGRQSWDVLDVHLAAAKPIILPSAKYLIVLETGQTLVRTPSAQILQSFVRDHGSTILDDLFDAGKIGQLAKLPGGNLRLLVKSEEVCQKLDHERITLMGNQYSFREFDVLGSRYFMDVFGIGPEMFTIIIASALHRLGCDVLYENFREVLAYKRLSMSTWRVYFRSTSCPEPLVLAGKVCEQICIEGRYYLARGKGAPLPVERLRMNERSPHCLLLPVNTPNSTQRVTKTLTPTTESKSMPSKRTGKTTKLAQEKQYIEDKKKKSTSSKAKSPSKTDENPLSSDNYRSLYIGTVRKRYHIVPINVLVPKDVATSKEAAHFFTKKHTKIVKDSRPTRVGEVVVNLLTEDLLTAQIPTKPDRLLQAEIHVLKAEKHLGFTSNGDSLLQFAFNHPIALHGVLNKGVRFNDPCLAEVLHVHTINRILAASDPNLDTTFITKWSKKIGRKVPTKRQAMFDATNSWWTESPE